GERADPLEGVLHPRPVGLGPARVLEGAPDLVEVEADVAAGDSVGVLGDVLGGGDAGLERKPDRDELLGGAKQQRAAHLEASVAEVMEEADALGAADQPEVGGAEAADHLLRGHGLDRLLLPGGAQRALEVDDLARRARGHGVEHPADRTEVEAVGLHAEDETEPGGVLVAVVAGTPPHHRGREQAARLVGADVAGGHPRRLGELVDGVDALAAASTVLHGRRWGERSRWRRSPRCRGPRCRGSARPWRWACPLRWGWATPAPPGRGPRSACWSSSRPWWSSTSWWSWCGWWRSSARSASRSPSCSRSAPASPSPRPRTPRSRCRRAAPPRVRRRGILPPSRSPRRR